MDSCKKESDAPELELTVTVYNVNLGYNPKILDACQTLKEYAQYVDKVREYAKMPFPQAVEEAVDDCTRNGFFPIFSEKTVRRR